MGCKVWQYSPPALPDNQCERKNKCPWHPGTLAFGTYSRPAYKTLMMFMLSLLMQIIQCTDPAIIFEALRNKDLDKRPLSPALNYFAGPHALPTLLTGVSDEKWKAVR